MKKYTTPNIEVTKFDVEDIIMESNVSLGSGAKINESIKTDLKSKGYVAVEW